MLSPATLASRLSIQSWLGLPRDRVRIVRRFIGIAITLAAAKVFLNTVGFALFLANEGPSQLPRFYVVLAAVAITLSAALGAVVDRVPKLSIARATLVAILIVAGTGKWMIDLGLPGAYFVILSSAFIFEIAIEILLWAACAAYLDTMELKRSTPLICLAIAVGGAFGGLFARTLAWTFESSDLLLVMLMFACLAALQFAPPSDVGELPDAQTDVVSSRKRTLRLAGLSQVHTKYPLLVLIGLNALTLTILYGIAEFLILSTYSAHFPEEQELTRFLGFVFALLQACEFLLLAGLSRLLLERTSPLVRNLVFPLTSLACLVYLAFSNKLSAAVITHINAEAASNAVFQPVHNANFLALPLTIQGRARTLSEGVFYPAGLAIAGGILLSMDGSGAVATADFIAILFALAFTVLNVGVGLLFQPTLIASVRSGVVPLADIASRIVGLSAAATDRVHEFLRSPLPGLRLDGIALSRWLGPEHVATDLLALASHPDDATRRALVRLAIEDGGGWGRRLTASAFDHDDRFAVAAMQVMLANREVPPAAQVAGLTQSSNPSLAAYASLLVEAADPSAVLARLGPLLHHPQAAADVIEGIVAARRADRAPFLVAALPFAPPDQQQQGLEFLRSIQAPVSAPWWRLVRRLDRHHDLRVRSEAMALLGPCRHRAARRALSQGLTDWSPRVRRRAAEGLAAQGEDAVDLLRDQVLALGRGSPEAAAALSAIKSKRARRALIEALQRLRREARDNALMFGRFAAIPKVGPWAVLATCAQDHEARVVEIAFAVLRGSLQRHVFGHVRAALASPDRRLRASAFEVLAALPRSGPVIEAIETLKSFLFEGFGNARAPADRFDARAALALARKARDPWLREAARIVEIRISATPAPVPGHRHTTVSGSSTMVLNEQDLERVLALKRIALFRYLSLDTLLAVARAVQVRQYLHGEFIVSGRGHTDHCLILEAGTVSLNRGGTTETLAAPACLNELVLIGEITLTGPIVALEPCRVLLLHAVVLQDLSRDYPEILLELCRNLAHRVRAAELADLGRTPLRSAGALSN